jgi:hypothetical protein
MPRPKFQPTHEQQITVKTMAACGISHENIAVKLEIAPKTLRKHFRRELRVGVIDAHLAIRKTVFKMGTSGRNIAASIYADRVWGALCARQSDTDGQPAPPPPIIIRGDSEALLQNAEGGPDR